VLSPATTGTVVQTVCLLVMTAGLFVFALFWALLWVGLAVERLVCVSLGVALTAAGLNFIDGALRPRWERGRWNPPPGYLVLLPGRLTSLGVGIWFGAIGVAFLGGDWLTEHAVPEILGALAAAFVLIMVGARYDRRRAEAARATEEAPPSGGQGSA
jgi:hypothetical protein